MTGMEMMLSAMSALFVLGGAALLVAAFAPARPALRMIGLASAALLIFGGVGLYLSSWPDETGLVVRHGLSLLFAHHMVRRAPRFEISREILLPVMALTFYAPFLGLLAWLAAVPAAKLRWRALNAY